MVDMPEQWPKPASPRSPQAVFKLFMGYAPGVGKTYNMLSEAIRRHSRGEDVVIGVVESHGRQPIVELARQLEAVPRVKREYKGTLHEEMDVDAILARKPKVVLIDELAHTNVDGSSVAPVLAHFVRENHTTQMVFGHSATTGWRRYIYLSTIHKFLRDAPAVNVHIMTQQAK